MVVEIDVAVVESVKTSAETEDQVHVGQLALEHALVCFEIIEPENVFILRTGMILIRIFSMLTLLAT